MEARIGQLLGDAQEAQLAGKPFTHAEKVGRPADRHDFRLLARALNGAVRLTDDEWRQSCRALVKLIKE